MKRPLREQGPLFLFNFGRREIKYCSQTTRILLEGNENSSRGQRE